MPKALFNLLRTRLGRRLLSPIMSPTRPADDGLTAKSGLHFLLKYIAEIFAFLNICLWQLVNSRWGERFSAISQPQFLGQSGGVSQPKYLLSIGLLFATILACIFLKAGRFTLARIAAAVPAGVGACVFLEYLLQIDLGTKALALVSAMALPGQNSGRLGPVTALCFFLLGSAVILSSIAGSKEIEESDLLEFWEKDRFRELSGLAVVMVTVAAAVCGAAHVALGFWPESAFLYYPTQMTVSAFGFFLILSIGLIFSARQQPRSEIENGHLGYNLGFNLGASMAVVGCGLSLALASAVKQADVDAARAQVNIYATNLSARFASAIDERLRSLLRISERWASVEGFSYEQWRVDALAVLRDFPGLNNIAWVSEKRIIMWAEPAEVARLIVGKLSNGEKARFNGYQQALQTGRATMTQPIELLRGGRGFLLISPLKKNLQKTGFLVEAFRFDELLAAAVVRDSDYAFALSEDGSVVFEFEQNSGQLHSDAGRYWQGIAHVKILDHTFVVRAVPSGATLASLETRLPHATLLTGAMLAYLLSIAIIYGKHSREQAKRSMELAVFQRALLDNAEFAIVSTDLDGIVTTVNARAEAISGQNRESFVGRPLKDFLELEENGKQELEQAFARKPFHFSKHEGLWRTSGTVLLPVEISLNSISRSADLKNPNRTQRYGFICVVQDISVKKAHEKLLEEQRLRLIASSRMGALGEMAGSIAHEINNPLAILQGRADQLSTMLSVLTTGNVSLPHSSATRIREICDKIQSTVQRIARIVTGLQRFGRDGGNDPFSPAFISEVIRETVALCQQKFKASGILLKVILPETESPVRCRPVQISQILLNLLSNAAYAVEPMPERWIEISLSQNESATELRVRDSGPGIPAAIQARIYEPFFTTKPVGVGTGLGLSISRRMIEEHGGVLNYSQPGQNPTFTVILPTAGLKNDADERV